MTVVGTEDVFVGGHTSGIFPGEQNFGSFDGFAMMLSAADGATLWTHQFGSNSDDRVWAVATSRDGGSIAVGGDTMGVLPGELSAGNSSWDGYVKLLNASDGTSLWTHQFGTHRGDFVRAMAVSPVTGSIVVGGSTYGTFPGAADNIGGRDPYVIMLSAIDGAQIWSCQFGGDSNGYIHALAADPVSGNIAVGGVTQSSGEYDAFVMLLSATDGAVLWAQQFGSSADDNLNAVAFHPAGNIVVGRDSVVMLLNSTDGAELWTHQFGSSDEESLRINMHAGDGGRSDHRVARVWRRHCRHCPGAAEQPRRRRRLCFRARWVQHGAIRALHRGARDNNVAGTIRCTDHLESNALDPNRRESDHRGANSSTTHRSHNVRCHHLDKSNIRANHGHVCADSPGAGQVHLRCVPEPHLYVRGPHPRQKPHHGRPRPARLR